MTNLGTISLTAPSAGFVLLTVNGFCNIPSAAAYEIDIGFSTVSGTMQSPVSNWWVFRSVTGSSETGVPLNASRLVSASAGANTYYLTATGPLTGSPNCSGNITAFFTPTLMSP